MVVGGGIFGVYAAISLSRRGLKVCLIEKEDDLLQKASIVNQARLHAGYHYPRSVATARIANDYRQRFTEDHKPFINRTFKQYYAIDKYSSFTDAGQFERFCAFLGIKAETVRGMDLFDCERIEELYITEEFSFDPLLVADYYRRLIWDEGMVKIRLGAFVASVEKEGGCWDVEIEEVQTRDRARIRAGAVINATYAGTNTVNALFGVDKIRVMHEICEIAFVDSPQLNGTGLTVMDGSFCSIMPYGLSNMLCLSSVVYTPHKISYCEEPVFDCQQINRDCRPDFISVCDDCRARPASNAYKMICQMRKYLAKSVTLDHRFSMYTIKTKLQASYIDDGRPTVISKLGSAPDFYCLFAGKINSIYEIEEVLESG